jgi:Asp/Glu/hydantoin racemase
LTKNKDTEITLFYLNQGMNSVEEGYFPSIVFLNDREVFEGVIQVAKKGYDAIIPVCANDPIVDIARQAVEIPVVAPLQSSLLFATMMGNKFGCIATAPETCLIVEELINKYGLKEKAVRVRPLGIPGKEQLGSLIDAHHKIEAFKRAARKSIADGAEIIIPACIAMTLALRLAPGCDEYPNGLEEVDGVPILDVLGTTIKVAESMVTLKKAGSAWISRKCKYVRPSKELEKATMEKFSYHGAGIWHL